MFKKSGEEVGEIDVHWMGNAVVAQYFMLSRPNPHERALELASNLSAIEFLNLFCLLIGTDYECLPVETNRYMTVFDFIAHRAWRASPHPPRPLTIHLVVRTGHRMVSAYFSRPPEVIKAAQIEFLTARDLMHALAFIDNLFEENSSSQKNDLERIERYASKGTDMTTTIIYTLRNPISGLGF